MEIFGINCFWWISFFFVLLTLWLPHPSIPCTCFVTPECTRCIFSIYPLPHPVKRGLANLVSAGCAIYRLSKTIFCSCTCQRHVDVFVEGTYLIGGISLCVSCFEMTKGCCSVLRFWMDAEIQELLMNSGCESSEKDDFLCFPIIVLDAFCTARKPGMGG